MHSMEEFYEKVLPEKGTYYCAAYLTKEEAAKGPQGVPYHEWYPSQAALAKGIERLDLMHASVWHACGSFGDKKNAGGRKTRAKANVQWLRSFWCEVDIRDDKGYATLADAGEALGQFIEITRLPTPLVVHSGGGLHLYWPLDEDIDRDTWEKYAAGLKTLTTKLGFKVDAGITGDCARVLRTPGTTNRKYASTLVKWCHDAGPYSLHDFSVLLFQNPKPVAKVYEKTLADGNLIASKCAQFRRLRDTPDKQSGEEWLACGNILTQCTDGERLFHEWSSQDPRYDANEAAKKWSERVKFDNAITCERFESLNPEGCSACPYRGKLKTPMPLGRERDSALPREVQEVLEAVEMPKGFKVDHEGRLTFVTEKEKDGEVTEKFTYVSNFPVVVEDVSFSENSSSSYTMAIKHWKPHDGWSTVHVRANEIARNCETALSDTGILCRHALLMKQYILESADLINKKRKTSMSYETFGWKESNTKFLWGDKLYGVVDGKVSVQTATLSGTAATLADSLRPGGKSKTGSFEQWRNAAQQLFAPGHEWQACTLLGGFAAPLMALSMVAEGGLVWSTYDQIGAKGKSLATLAACSVWGDYKELSTTITDTHKGRLAKLGALRHLPIGFDEMKRTDEKLVKSFLQEFTMGSQGSGAKQNRQLMDQSGNWCTVMLTSSNQELVGVIESGNGSKAMKSRVMEVQASELPIGKREHKESFKREFSNNCGYAGEKYIKYVVYLQGTGAMEGLLAQAEAELVETYNFGPEQRFKLEFFKAIYVAAQILVETEMLAFSPERIIEWLITSNGHVVAGSWIDTEREDMADVLSEYLHSSIRNTLVVEGPFNPGKPHSSPPELRPVAELTIRKERLGNSIIISKQALRKWLLEKKDINIKHFVKELLLRKIIREDNSKKSLGANTDFGGGRTMCIVVNGNHEDLKAIEDPNDNVINLEEAKRRLP